MLKDFNLSGVSKGTWTRLAVFLAALINQILVSQGIVDFPFTEAEIAEGIADVLFVVTALVGFWKNNSFTKKAQEADKNVLHKA